MKGVCKDNKIGSHDNNYEPHSGQAINYSETCSNHVWALTKWPFNTGGLSIEVKINSKGAFGTQRSGL